jgi:purine-binding chemotaxis protein CheW
MQVEHVAAEVEMTGSSGGSRQRYLVAGLGAVECGVPLDLVEEIRGAPAADDPDARRPYLRRPVVFRGELIPVLDARVLFGVAGATRAGESTVIMVRTGRRRLGVVVDRAMEIVEVAAASVQRDAADSPLDPAFVEGVVPAPRRLVILDVARLFRAASEPGD